MALPPKRGGNPPTQSGLKRFASQIDSGGQARGAGLIRTGGITKGSGHTRGENPLLTAIQRRLKK